MVKLNPSRALMIEKYHPILKQDIELIKDTLGNYDEIVLGIGDATTSHEKGALMETGERMEVIDATLQAEGITPDKYIMVPVRNDSRTSGWVSEAVMVSPRFNTFVTRNFKNAAAFSSNARTHGFNVTTIPEQKPDLDYYDLIRTSGWKQFIPEAAMDKMSDLKIPDRINTVYDHKDSVSEAPLAERFFFLGRGQPVTGIFSEENGHLGNIIQGLRQKPQGVIGVGSAQGWLDPKNPMTGGQRVEVWRYVLQKNGISADKFHVIPLVDIPENPMYAGFVKSMCPSFDSLISGNDWGKKIFEKGGYDVVEVDRTTNRRGVPISGTLVRNTIDGVLDHPGEIKGDPILEETLGYLNTALDPYIDKHAQEILHAVGYFETMKFLNRAIE